MPSAKRIARFIGASAFFLSTREVIASSNIPPSSTGPNSITRNAASEAVSNTADAGQPVLPEESSLSSIISPDPSSSHVKKKKRPKAATATKRKPTKTKPANASSPQASASLRRIRKEYEDAVKMGICYDWARQKLVRSKSTESVGQEDQGLIWMGPLASNLRHWHFSFRGCGIYEHGIYHGRILLPKDYPSTPPRVQLWTPSGRFIPYHDICLSASSYHPESWTPRWTVLSLVQALRLHMLTNPQEIGGKVTSQEGTLEYARQSLIWEISFKAGNLRIHVDHALLLSRGVLSLENSSYAATEEVQEASEVVAEPTNQIIPPLQEDSPHNISQADVAVEEASEKVAVGERNPGMITIKTHKQRKKSKSKETKKKGAGRALNRENSDIQEATFAHFVVVSLSKVFGSPARIALFSLALFFWVNSGMT